MFLFRNSESKKLLQLTGKISRKLPVKIRHTSANGKKGKISRKLST
jgi:hypothetical protein